MKTIVITLVFWSGAWQGFGCALRQNINPPGVVPTLIELHSIVLGKSNQASKYYTYII